MFHLVHGSCVRVGGVLAFGMLRVISRESVTLFLRLAYEPSETNVEAIAKPVQQSITIHIRLLVLQDDNGNVISI